MATSSSHVEECPDTGPVCAGPDAPPPYQHVQRLYAAELTLDAAYGVSSWLGFELTLPLRQVTTRIRYEDLAGAPYTPVPADTHHRNQTLLGPGDPWLLAHLGGTFAPGSIAAKVGVAVPLGRTEDDPFTLGRMGLPHQHIQFGTGTFDPLLGASAEHRFAGWSLAATGLARLVLYENGHGYRAGHRFYGTLLAASPLGTQTFGFSAGVDAFHEAAERWGGVIQEEGNIGRTDVLAGVAVSKRFGGWTASLGLKVPVLIRAEGAQVSYPALLTLSGATTFHR